MILRRFPTLPASSALLALSLLSGACAPSDEGRNAAQRALDELFASTWEYRLSESPSLATSVGDHRANDQLDTNTLEDLERRVGVYREKLTELDSIDLDTVSDNDRINAAIFRRQLENRIALFEFGDHEMPFTAETGFHTGFARLPSNVPLTTVQDVHNYISRLSQWPRVVDQQIEHMRAGIARGFTQPKVVLRGFEQTMSAHIVDDLEDSVFFAPFKRLPDTIDEATARALAEGARETIGSAIVPSYQKLYQFFVEEYLPNARDTVGASELPNGRAYYEQRVRFFTTLDLTPEDVHQIGLDEVARIRAEMEQIIEEVGFDGSFDEFLTFLRTDPQFYAKTPRELLMVASFISKRIDAQLPKLFATLPRLPYGVAPVPDHIAPKYTAGRYVGPPQGSTEPGYYWVNTYALETRPLYALPALSLHEAVPGHHFQNGLARERDEQPPFRRYDYISAYGEGWGLYSEFLGIELGIYETPYDHFGRLTYEMWRACRLVVDTGVHAFGWTRDQMLDYLTKNTALSLHEIETETDRYISWPGQALSYKLGELKIKELRARAEEQLGDDFDIRAFHDAVLATGSVPLDVLDEQMNRFIEGEKADA